MEIEIPYKPRNWSKKLHESTKRFFSLIIHRRGGKTTALINHQQRAAIDDAWEKNRLLSLMPSLSSSDLKELMRGRNYGIVYPTYRQAENVAWKMLKYYAEGIPGLKSNEQKLRMVYPNGATLGLFGADNPDSLRGIPFWGLAFDEYSQQSPTIFSEVLSKSLADHLGFAVFAGTIKGKNQLWRTNEAARANPNDWEYVWQDIDYSLKTEEGPTIAMLRRALEDDKKLMVQGMTTQAEFDQEWYLSPESAIKGAYYASELSQARKENRIKLVPHDPALKVHTVWDLGVGANLVIGFYQHIPNEVRLIDGWQGSGDEGITHAVAAAKNKGYVFGKHFVPHDAAAREETSGKRRVDVMKSLLGNEVYLVPNLSPQEGIDAAKRMWPRLWISEPKCPYFLDAIAQYRREWDEKRGMFKDQPYHDWSSDWADQLRYAALVEDQMTNEDRKPFIQKDPEAVSRFQGVEKREPSVILDRDVFGGAEKPRVRFRQNEADKISRYQG